MRLDIQNPTVFMTISGLWGLAMVAILVSAIRLCYEIERRSGWRKPGGLPTYAAWIPVLFNSGVAQDEETQRLRWKMIQRFLTMLVGFGFFYLVLYTAGV